MDYNKTAIEKIEHAIHNKKDTIDLTCLGLSEIPEKLRELKALESINISSNNLEKLPDWFQEFTELKVLDARSNKLKALFHGLGNLQNLISINVRNNQFDEIPYEIRELKNLIFISVDNNNIERIPSWFFSIPNINIENNPIVDPPMEVYSRGTAAVLNYFLESSHGTEKLYEAKLLIVGEPGAGKTTLMNKILNEDYYLNIYEPSTKGIEIKPYYFQTPERNDFRVNIWDFGGQEIYHATHQFFLTKRSLYILLSDNRDENTDFNYWLQTIELLSGNSPLLIVQNEKQDRKKDINEAGIKERFKTVQKIISFNVATNKNRLRSLIREIESQVIDLPHIGAELPKIWVDIRKALEARSLLSPYISEIDYLNICKEKGMPEKERASFLSDYFHDLGVFLHFKDNAVLKRWIILKPDWGTEAVYKVLDNEKVITSNGYFSRKDLMEIWNQSIYSDMHEELISLMIKFELCYQLENSETFIAAQLLQRDKPSYQWTNQDNLHLKYDYEFMPKGLITRFIVRMHYYISSQRKVWREGVILEREETFAEVIETYGKKEIKIRISGKNKKEFLAIILDSIDKIHLTYTNLKVAKLIPCNCNNCVKSSNPYYFEYNSLKKYLSNRIFEDRCKESLLMVKISSLIDDVLGNRFQGLKTSLDLYISYNDEDKFLKTELHKHLRTFERSGFLKISDRAKVNSGENERNYIRDRLDTANVIVVLLSPDYLNSELNYEVELAKALDRFETKSCLVIPIIIRECNWKSTILKIKPILFNGKPIFSDKEKIDEALTDTMHQLKSSIDAYIIQVKELAENSVVENEPLNYSDNE
ncbi:MAG: GTPase [Chitinophagaceae bacterium]|nr:GTPase [Chitinophagaceae bacterium]